MENRKGTSIYFERSPAYTFSIFCFLFSIFLFSNGCGAPGEPVPPTPPVPVAIKDLAAHQIGDGVQLAFTLPTNSVTGDRLPEPPAVEILRGGVKPDGSAEAKSFRVVETIPGALVADFVTQKRVEYMDMLSPQDPETSAGAILVYRVRTRASRKHASVDSNTVFVQVAPVPQKIPVIESRVTESAFEFGKSYLYFVRSFITTNEIALESSDSQHVVITPRDTFPPATPQGLVAALLAGPAPGTFVVELSWSINLETDLAGYRVYKSEQEGTKGQLVNADLLPTPVVRDTSVEPGHRYKSA